MAFDSSLNADTRLIFSQFKYQIESRYTQRNSSFELNVTVCFLCLFLLCSDLDPAVVVPKDSEVMLKGEDLTATCNALSSLKTSTVWYKVQKYEYR